ncbi:MAG: hypothetical protein ACI4L1_01340 [Christensenellales bacterium]
MNKDSILKAYMLQDGLNITAEAKKVLDQQSDIWLMDDYITCCGLTLHYNNEYATIGINQNSNIKLIAQNGKLFIKNSDGILTQTEAITPPDYMRDEIIIEGKKICVYVNTYTDRVRLQLMSGCMNKCKFCNAKEFKYEFNSISGLEKALEIALSQSNVRHILISSGSAKIEDLGKLTEMYEYFGKKYSQLDLDLMMTPRGFDSYTDNTQYEAYLKHLKNIGISGLSINMELNSSDNLNYFCPEKAIIGHDNYIEFIKLAVKIFGKNKVRSLLIVGLEPIEETLKGVEILASIGCNPVLSPLFPYGEANMAPNAQLFIEAKEKSEEICKKYGIKMGPLCKPCSHNVL